MKAKLFKICCILIALIIPTLSLTACSDPYKNVTVIYVTNFNGGVGTKWFDNASERFKEKVEDVSYEDGKTGVHFEVNETMYINAENAKTDGMAMYFTQFEMKKLFENAAEFDQDDYTSKFKSARNQFHRKKTEIFKKID